MEMMETSKPHIIKTKDSQTLAGEALHQFIDAAKTAIKERGVFYVAISGGQTPAAFYELLSEKDAYSQIDWEKVHLFWVDERCVLPSSDASNFGLAAHTFLLDVPIPGENIHRVTGENSDYEAAAREYERLIRDVFGTGKDEIPQFDLMVLGMGADGHIASLIPNSNVLFDTKHLVCVAYRMDDSISRITLTLPVIRAAARIIVLVSGRGKAEIVREVFRSEPDEVKYPVHFLWPNMEKITWLMDSQAASLL